jgi:4-hydroxy-tetrahydrodipicolinate synthase
LSRIRGPIFAIVTPFDSQGTIDTGALGEYLAFLESNGVKTIIANGTTGEFASMTMGERMVVLECCRAGFRGSIMANVSACAGGDCISLLEQAAGYADAALILPPFYYADAEPPGVLAFFESVLDRSDIPVYLYNFPRHTSVEVQPDMLAELRSRYDFLRGIKDSSGKLITAMQFKSVSRDLQVFVGSDPLSLQALDSGLDGSVTGGGNAVPECIVGISKSFAAGNRGLALEWQAVSDLWTSFRKSLGIQEVAATKAGLRARIDGFPLRVRPPLMPPDAETVDSTVSYLSREIMPAIASLSRV